MKRFLLALITVFTLAAPGGVVLAQGTKDNLCGGASFELVDPKCGDELQRSDDGITGVIRDIVNVLTVIVGIAAVFMIIFSGFKFVTAGGDSGKVTSARTTLIYSIVGLIIVALAQAIVRFVLVRISS